MISILTRWQKCSLQQHENSNNYGLIHTYVWAFDQKSDWEYVEHFTNIFRKNGADIYYVELVAPQEVRLQRNITENRLNHKFSKRDIETSNKRLFNIDEEYRCISNDGEIPFDNYIKIDNSNLSPEIVARMIKEHFNL